MPLALTLTLCLTTAAAAEAEKPHALIVTRTKAARSFVSDAAKYLVGRGMTPITLEELNDLIELERQKDLAGCNEVTCFAEIAGAFGNRFILLVKANKAGNRAVLSLYEQGARITRVDRKIVSRQSAVDKLVVQVKDFNVNREQLIAQMEKLPCGFPWTQAKGAFGEPSRARPASHDQKSHSDGMWDFYYFDIEVKVLDGTVRSIRDTMGKGTFVMGCFAR